MRWLCSVVLLLGCHKQKPPADNPADTALASAVDAMKDQAFKDLQNDVVLLRAQLQTVNAVANAAVAALPRGRAQAALYTCERLAIAQQQLSGDARAQALLGEADALCSYRAPMAAVVERLPAMENNEAPAKADCAGVRDLFNRVGGKYKNDVQLASLTARFKVACPKMRLGHPDRPSMASAPAGPDPRAQRDACKKRCDDAAFSCRSSCQYCGTCTTDKTWEWCNSTCNNCRQGCEQNEKFCQAGCGS